MPSCAADDDLSLRCSIRLDAALQEERPHDSGWPTTRCCIDQLGSLDLKWPHEFHTRSRREQLSLMSQRGLVMRALVVATVGLLSVASFDRVFLPAFWRSSTARQSSVVVLAAKNSKRKSIAPVRRTPAEVKLREQEVLAGRELAVSLEEEFLKACDEGVGGGIDPLILADRVAELRRWPPQELTRLLNGDWRLHASDGGDIFVQMGTGLHGLPFIQVSTMFFSLRARAAGGILRAIEILKDVGPAKHVTTILKGDYTTDSSLALNFEYTGMVDGNDKVTRQEREGATRKYNTQILYYGQKTLVLRISDSQDRKGGFAVFEKVPDLQKRLKDLLGETMKILP